jgi:hypothetical protein
LGATLHHLVTKQDPSLNPFNWVPARRINPNTSPTLENALLVSTSLDPARRYKSIEEFAQYLGIYLPAGLANARPIVTGTHHPRSNTVSVGAPVTPAQPTAPAKPAAPTSQKPRTSGTTKKKAASTPASTPKAQPVTAPPPAPAPVPVPSAVPVVASTATAGTTTENTEIVAPTHTGVVDEKQVAAAPAAPAEKKQGEASKLVVPEQVVDLGEARWNNRAWKKVPITSTGGAMRGMVLATQPWIAYNPQHFQGNAVALDVRVKRRQLQFGRLELQVPNLFAIIWARSRRVLPFIMVWLWLIVLVAGALGRTLLTVAAAVVGGLLVMEGLMWLWAQHVRLLVPTEKLNTGRLMVKSSGGDSSIEVRVLARPSWAQRAAGWSVALLLFIIEITLVTWIALSLFGIRMPF